MQQLGRKDTCSEGRSLDFYVPKQPWKVVTYVFLEEYFVWCSHQNTWLEKVVKSVSYNIL